MIPYIFILAAVLLFNVQSVHAQTVQSLLNLETWQGGAKYGLLIQGDLAGDHAELNGIVIQMRNEANGGFGITGQDTARVRGIIGTVTTDGPGSARFLHGHAIGEPGATGAVSAFNGQVTCNAGNPFCRGIEVAATGEGPAEGIHFGASGPGHFGYLLTTTSAVVDHGFALLATGTPAGRLVWSGGGSIDSPIGGVIRIDGTLENATITLLEARIRALEVALGITPGTLPPVPPTIVPPVPPAAPPVTSPGCPHGSKLIFGQCIKVP